jgi:SAM-dependent methyltransferase
MSVLEKELKLLAQESGLLKIKKLPDEQIELEVRLGTKPKSSGTNRLFWHNAYYYVRSLPSVKTWSKYTLNIKSDGTGASFRERGGLWQMKKEKRAVYLTDNWAKASLSIETPSPPPTISRSIKTITRHISRHSFRIGASRVDFSKVYENGKLTFEVEVEYLHIGNTNFIQEYIDLIYSITSEMFKTPLPFTYNWLTTASSTANAVLGITSAYKTHNDIPVYIDKRYMSVAVPLGFDDIQYNVLFKDSTTKKDLTWNVCLKTDGERRALVVSEQGTWLLNPPLQAALYAKTEYHSGIKITIADGELCEGVFWVSDCMFVDGKDIRRDYHTTRLEKFRLWQEGLPRVEILGTLPINYKEHSQIYGLDFFDKCQSMWTSRATCKFPVDGLIFTPNEYSYDRSTDEDNKPVIKWKPIITIDLKVRKNIRGEILVYAVGAEKKDVQFTGNEKSRLKNIIMGKIIYDEDAVIEFECKDGNLIAFKDRAEKIGANKYSVAISNWEKSTIQSMHINEETLLCKNNVLMRKYHNREKTRLLLKAKKSINQVDCVLLDIGSGNGGDIKKWYECGYTKIFCVEPDDLENSKIKEFNRRLKKYPKSFSSNVHILKAKGQNTNEIIDFVYRHGVKKVDVVSMMDSLTYFFDPDRKFLKALASTVKSLLKDGGLFVWKALNGKSVKQASDLSNSKTLIYGDSSITLLENNMVHAVLPPNQDTKEYLTNIHDLKTYLELTGESEPVQSEGLLLDEYLNLSKLFHSGIFVRGVKLILSKEITDTFDIPNIITKKVDVKVDKYKSAIEALERVFTSKSHLSLLYNYANLAKKVDMDYISVGNEPVYYKFETAHSGYFAIQYIKRSATEDLIDVDIILTSDESPIDDNKSLAFASLLNIDLYIVDPDMNLLSTNAIRENHHHAMVIKKYSDGYAVKTFNNYPILLSNDNNISGYKKLNIPNFHSLYRDAVRFVVDTVGNKNNKLIPHKKPMNTNILNRLAYINKLDARTSYLSLANYLVNNGVSECGIEHLNKVGMQSDKPQDIISFVNRLMVNLTKS